MTLTLWRNDIMATFVFSSQNTRDAKLTWRGRTTCQSNFGGWGTFGLWQRNPVASNHKEPTPENAWTKGCLFTLLQSSNSLFQWSAYVWRGRTRRQSNFGKGFGLAATPLLDAGFLCLVEPEKWNMRDYKLHNGKEGSLGLDKPDVYSDSPRL